MVARYGALHMDADVPGKLNLRVVRAALLLGACAVVAMVVVGHVVPRTVMLSKDSQKELERLERETFESPDSTYDKTLEKLRRTKMSQGAATEQADAWASADDSFSQPFVVPNMAQAKANAPDLEHRIAADISHTLAKTVAQEVRKEVRDALHPRAQAQEAKKHFFASKAQEVAAEKAAQAAQAQAVHTHT
jgi:hypothetical protein